MKKNVMLSVSFVLMMFLVQVASAADVGIVVEFPDGSVKTDCVSVAASASGYDILQQSTFDIGWSDSGAFGRSLCKINGVGDEISGAACVWDPDLSWAFYTLNTNSWDYSLVGLDTYSAVDKAVLGFVRSGFDFLWNPTEEPPVKTYEQVCEKLSVKNIKAYVDGKKESGADEDGGKIDVVPGSKLELKIELENLYTDDEDIKIKDITIEGVLESIDDGDDVDDEANDFNLNPEKDKEVTLEFDIPMEVDEDNYDLTVTIEGENENGFPYSEEIEFEVDVDKEKHDIIFNKLKFSNDNVECGSSANLDVKVVNLGVNDESVKFTILNEELGISIQESFELSEDPFDKDNSFSKTYKIMLPDDINPGMYLLRADLFYGNNIESSTVELNIACKGTAAELEEKSEGIKENVQIQNIQTSPLTQASANIAGAAVTNTVEEKNISNTKILIISTIAAVIIILIAGIVLLVSLFRK
jgi:hypothetical protein